MKLSCDSAEVMPRRWFFLLIIPPLLAMLAYSRVVTLNFINMDDPPLVTENPHIRTGWRLEAVQWALSADLVKPSINMDYWQPITALSRILDVSLYGLDPRGHHLMNLLLHAANTFLLASFLASTTRRILPSVLVGALLAVHPLNVSSVAWVTERKNLLGLFFLLLCLIAFSDYLKAPSRRRLATVIAAYALSLMSKPIGLTLALILPFLAFWPLVSRSCVSGLRNAGQARDEHVSTEESFRARSWVGTLSAWAGTLPVRTVMSIAAPMLILAAISAWITMRGQPRAFLHVDHWRQISNAIVTIGDYLSRAVLPVGLAIPYPFPLEPIPVARVAFFAAATIAVTVAALLLRKRAPFFLTGWAWYLLAILPTLGLIHEASADRFTYFPMIGINIIAAWSLQTLGDRSGNGFRWCLVAGATVWILVLAVVTFREVGWWRDSTTLFTHAIEVTGPNPLAEENLGMTCLEAGDAEGGLRRFERSLALFSGNASVHHERGIALERLGRDTDAIEAYSNALRVDPDYFSTQYNRAILLTRFGRKAEAETDYLAVLSLHPDDVLALNNLGSLYNDQGRYVEALQQFGTALQLTPNNAGLICNFGITLFNLGAIPAAADCFERALEADPTNATARRNLEMIRRTFQDTNVLSDPPSSKLLPRHRASGSRRR